MRSSQELLEHLASIDVSLTREGNQLKVNAPKGRLTPELIAEMQQHKTELLRSVSEQVESSTGKEASIPKIGRDQDIALSFAQQRLWLLDQLEPGNPLYNIASALKLKGPLNLDSLQFALDQIVRRHEALRTRFASLDGRLVQNVTPPSGVGIRQIDCRAEPVPEQAAREQATAIGREAFDLSTGSTMRVALFRVSDDEYLLLFAFHHIVFDGWSASIFLDELSTHYNAHLAGDSGFTEAPVIQYPDFSAWQQNWIRGDRLASQLEYWDQQLTDIPAAISLPTNHGRPAIQTHRGATVGFSLDRALTDRLRAFAREQQATIYMVLLAAFNVLLFRYSTQEDLVVGTPIAGRVRPETEGLIGCFINTLVLRTSLSGNPTFVDLLGRVRAATLDAYSNQDLPFEKLVEQLQPERDLARTPLFQVMFAFENTPRTELSMRGLDVSVDSIPLKTAKFDLTLAMQETESGLTGEWEYATDLFTEETIRRTRRHFLAILEAITREPMQRISRIPLIQSPAERQLLLTQWNATRSEYDQTAFAHRRFERKARDNPGDLAVQDNESRLSYRELNRHANRLARQLIALGLGAEQAVGIYLGRRAGMLSAILASLKAGASFVPLDPAYPADRTRYMIEDAGLGAIICDDTLAPQLQDTVRHVISIDEPWDQTAAEYDHNPEVDILQDSLAYSIYTSGSTGTPKGVQISHMNLTNFLETMQTLLPVSSADIMLSVTSISFDISLMELLLPLCAGGTVRIASREQASDGEQLVELISACNATVMQATPTTWQLIAATALEKMPAIKIFCGGEALKHDLAIRFMDRGCEVWNLYGPTEATIWATLHKVSGGFNAERSAIEPIGRPIANTRIYILDQNLDPCPIGVPGELFIAGSGLARGYRNKPALTASSFLPDPYSDDAGMRMYKTGDLARFRNDGTVEFLGRIDHQIKIRGYRIELGEIESNLASHPDIREALVVAREDRPGNPQLVAYILKRNEEPPVTSELRAWLRKTLPEYMIPNAFVALDAFPLTPNGKTDRRALPAPQALSEEEQYADVLPYTQPRDSLEYQLSEIWEDIFNTPLPIGIHDNFFDIGGHSLMAVTLIAQVRNVFSCELPLASLFQAPTIAQLAELIRDGRSGASQSALVPLQTSGTQPPIFIVHLADGIIFQLHTLLARRLGKFGRVYGIQARGVDGLQEPYTDFRDMAAAYLQEIFQLQPTGAYRLIGLCDGATIVYEMAQQLRAAGKPVELLALVVPTPPPSGSKPARLVLPEFTRALKGHPPELKKIVDAHFLARYNYYPQPYPESVVYIEASDDPASESAKTRSAWQTLIQGKFTHIRVPGNHNSAVREPLVNTLVEKLGRFL